MGLPLFTSRANSTKVGLFFVSGAAVPGTHDWSDLSCPTLPMSSCLGLQAEVILTPGAAGESELTRSKLDDKT